MRGRHFRISPHPRRPAERPILTGSVQPLCRSGFMADAAQLYLPLSRDTAVAVMAAFPDLADLLGGLSVPELAALHVLQKLPDLSAKPSSRLGLERLLAQWIEVGNESGAGSGFARETRRLLKPEALAAGLATMGAMGVDLLEADAVRERGYLRADGGWDFSFSPRRQATEHDTADPQWVISGVRSAAGLTGEQFRVPQVLGAEIEEPLHIQGYAGTGKTHLITVILDLLMARGVEAKRILVLTQTFGQLQGLRHRLPAGVVGMTYNDLITEMMPRGVLDPSHARLQRRGGRTQQLYPEAIRSVFGLADIGATTALSIAQAAKTALFLFCVSGDARLLPGHLPQWFRTELTRQKSTADAATLEAMVLHTAEHLWQETLNPSGPDLQPPVRGYHQIKYAALNGLGIPAHYSHVILDESHDLSQAMLQVLDKSLATCITLGDDYQNLAGRPAHHDARVRCRSIVQSYRAGHRLEAVVNSIITAHPLTPRELFAGSDAVATVVDYYRTPAVPERPAAILVSDLWAVWTWAQRLAQEKRRFALLESPEDLNLFVQDCIELKRHGTRPRHGKLFRYRTWDQLADDLVGNAGFDGIHKLLQRGYSTADWAATRGWVSAGSTLGYVLGTLERARNREFDAVMLTPDTVDKLWKVNGRDQEARGAVGAALYIGATRVRRHLLAPESLRHWVEEAAQGIGA